MWSPCVAGAHDALTLLSDRIAPGAVLLFDEVRCSAWAPVTYCLSCYCSCAQAALSVEPKDEQKRASALNACSWRQAQWQGS